MQADAQYSGKFCFTVLCAPVERERAYSFANARLGWATGDEQVEVAVFVDTLFERKYRTYAFDSSLFAGLVAGFVPSPGHGALQARSASETNNAHVH